MRERQVVFNWDVQGTLAADLTRTFSLPEPFIVTHAGGTAANDSSATLALSGGATIAAAAIGDSGAFLFAEPTSEQHVAALTVVTATLDYDGASGTAAAGGVEIIVVCQTAS